MQHNLLGVIAKQISRNGAAPAISGKAIITYEELERRSGSVAAGLCAALSGVGGRVVVLSSETESLVPALLGVLRASCTYVPMQPDLPEARLRVLAERVKPAAVVYEGPSQTLVRRVFPGVPALEMGSLQGTGMWPDLSDDHPAYVFFTSGSTGEPKGIVGRYASLGQFIEWEAELLGIDESIRVAQLISPMFDAYLRDTLLPLAVGGCCCVPDSSSRSDSAKLAQFITGSRVQLVHTVPSVFRTLFGDASSMVKAFPSLRYVMLSGEPLLASDVALWRQRLGESVALYNLYGATETTMIKFFHRVTAQDESASCVPIGEPMAGASAWVAGSDLAPVVDGEHGEILVETQFRTLGYLDDLEATDRVFVRLPNNPQRVVYRTGDIGRKRPDGEFEFLGRADRQVKVRGVRIEPTEIEAAARAVSGVLDCVVDVEPQGDGGAILVLYATLSHGLTPEQLRSLLLERLPVVYAPSAVRACRGIPRLLSGKVDFQSLRAAAKAARRSPVAPETPTEQCVVGVFQALLNEETLGVEDNFFDAGGHSLLAIQVLSRLREVTGVDVPLTAFFAGATARSLAQYIDSNPPSEATAEQAAAGTQIDVDSLSDHDLELLLADLTREGEE